MTEKSELLNQLKIDRSETTTARGVSTVGAAIIAIVSVAVGGFGAVLVFGGSTPAPA